MSTIHARVAVVINFIDAVTEKPIYNRITRINIKQGNGIVWKDNSRVVILELDNVCDIDIFVEDEKYQDVSIHANLDEERYPIIYNIWLTPSEKYPFTPDMKVINGKSKLQEIMMARMSSKSIIQLISDVCENDKIRIWGIKGAIDGKMLLLKEGDNREVITLTGKCEDEKDCYYMATKPINIYHKGITSIYPVTKVVIGSDGKYWMAYRNLLEDETIEIL